MDVHHDRSGEMRVDGTARVVLTRRVRAGSWPSCSAVLVEMFGRHGEQLGRDFASSQLAGYVRRPGYPPVPVIRLLNGQILRPKRGQGNSNIYRLTRLDDVLTDIDQKIADLQHRVATLLDAETT